MLTSVPSSPSGCTSGENEDFMRAFDFGQQFVNDLFFLPGHAFFYVHFTPRGWEFKRHVRVLEEYGNKLITDVVLKIQKRRKVSPLS
jgi:hypothetical protein